MGKLEAGILDTSTPNPLIVLVVIELMNEESLAAKSILLMSALSLELDILIAIKLFLNPFIFDVSIDGSKLTKLVGVVAFMQLRGT